MLYIFKQQKRSSSIKNRSDAVDALRPPDCTVQYRRASEKEVVNKAWPPRLREQKVAVDGRESFLTQFKDSNRPLSERANQFKPENAHCAHAQKRQRTRDVQAGSKSNGFGHVEKLSALAANEVLFRASIFTVFINTCGYRC